VREIASPFHVTGGTVRAEQSGDKLRIELRPEDHREVDTIVKLELSGSAMEIVPMGTEGAK